MYLKKIRLYYWLVLAFVEKYLLYVALSFFITSLLFVLYLFFSKDIIQVLTTDTHIIGIQGSYTPDNLPSRILNNVTVPLFTQNQDGLYESKLIQSVKHNANFTRFDFTLFPNIVFTDGKPFTSKDIQLDFKDVKTTWPDNNHVVYETTKSFPPFLAYLTKPIFTVNPFRGIKGDYLITQARFVSGGDRLESLTLTPLVVGKPKLIYKFYRTDSELVTAYKLQEIDEFTTTGSIASDTFKKWSNTVVEESSDYTKVASLFFNLNQPLLKEKDVRLAIYGSIPVRTLQTMGNIAVSPLSPTSNLYDSTIPRIAENPEVNKSILRKFFTQASDSAKFKLSTSFEFINLAHAIQEVIQSAGGKVTVDVSGLQQGELTDLTLGYWSIPPEVNQYFVWHSSQKSKSNITQYSNQKVDKLLEDFRATDSATMQREYMSDFQKKLVEESPAIFLYYPHTFTIRRKK